MSEHHTAPPKDLALRAKALQTLMVEKGMIEEGVVDTIIDIFSNKLGPRGGARMVAKAWVDPEYKQRLLDKGEEAARELGLSGLQTEMLHVVENTDEVHNAVVCTLCSCYPWAVLGLAPAWYKSNAYRSRIVLQPRETLAEFGLTIDPKKEVRVWDSNSEIRYMVLPQRPAGTEGMTEEQLAELVSRDAMIGTALANNPA